MNRLALIIPCVLFLSAILPERVTAQPAGMGFIVLPFRDNSGFEGPWDLRMEVPRYVAAYVAARYRLTTISPAVVKSRLEQEGLSAEALENPRFWPLLREAFKVRFVLDGSVEAFDVSRFTTGAVEVGGYESFKGSILVAYRLFDLDRLSTDRSPEAASGEANGEYADRSFALTLFGKPTSRTVEYLQLGRLRFGSEDFNNTVIGEACRRFGRNLSEKLEKEVPILRSRDLLSVDTLSVEPVAADSGQIVFRGRVMRGMISFVEGDEAFVTLGVEDGVQKGQLASVYADTSHAGPARLVKIGAVELVEIRGPHLSLARIRSGKSEIRSRQEVRVRVLE